MSTPFYAVGRYVCKMMDQAMGESSNGNPQFALRFVVLGPVDPKDLSSYTPSAQQYERTFYRVIVETTIEYFMEDLKNLGFTGTSFRDLDPASPNFYDFRGVELDMWCSHKPDPKGGMKEEWRPARKPSALEVKPIEPKKLRDLDNLFGKHLKALGGPKPVAAPPANQVPVGMGIDDSDIPFMRFDVPCI